MFTPVNCFLQMRCAFAGWCANVAVTTMLALCSSGADVNRCCIKGKLKSHCCLSVAGKLAATPHCCITLQLTAQSAHQICKAAQAAMGHGRQAGSKHAHYNTVCCNGSQSMYLTRSAYTHAVSNKVCSCNTTLTDLMRAWDQSFALTNCFSDITLVHLDNSAHEQQHMNNKTTQLVSLSSLLL